MGNSAKKSKEKAVTPQKTAVKKPIAYKPVPKFDARCAKC
jgi:hypothetical protein